MKKFSNLINRKQHMMKKTFKSILTFINKTLNLFNLQLKKTYSGYWDYDKAFVELYKKVKEVTLVKHHRAFVLYSFAKCLAQSTSGDVAQVGVYRGGTARMIAECFADSNKKFYLFDTFEGLPPFSIKDGNIQNETANMFTSVNFEQVEKLLSTFNSVSFRKGFFPDTTQGLEDKKFCFVYLDGDLYQTTKDGLDFFYPRMVPGGVIILDDYGTNIWPGVEKAVKEFCDERQIYPIRSAASQALIMKTL